MTYQLYPANETEVSEAQFYAFYDWCLNPFLTVQDLLERLREEIERYEQLPPGWQRQECKINLHIFVCAIAFVVDDYLAWYPWTFSSITGHFPKLQVAVRLAQWCFDIPRSLQGMLLDRALVRWRERWSDCVDRVCDILINESELVDEQWSSLKASFREASSIRLPKPILRRRMRIPEGYRDQDLTHYDALFMIQKFLTFQSDFDRKAEFCVIGIRTAGAYFSPVVKAYLSAIGCSQVSWMTIRPKERLSRWEQHKLRALARRSVRVFLIDDHPNTGATFLCLCELLTQAGVSSKQITILAPGHPVRPNWTLPELVEQGVTIIRLEPDEFHKAKLLRPEAVEPMISEYYRGKGWSNLHLKENPQVDAINVRLEASRRHSFQVHIKRVFEVEGQPLPSSQCVDAGQASATRVFVKSVGWGWVGYHAYISGIRLAGFVPRVIGLRNGLLFSEWIERKNQLSDSRQSAIATAERPVNPDNMPLRLSTYVAKRVEQLRLAEDPYPTSNRERATFPVRTVWDEIIEILRNAYSSFIVGRLKVSALRRELQQYVSPVPTLIDGQMKLDEWIATSAGIYKVDFEHYNCIRAAIKTVDPAYDIAAAVFEFQLSESAERKLLENYRHSSGDQTIEHRLILYKLVYGVYAMQNAAMQAFGSSLTQKREAANQRYVSLRNFLIYQLQRFCASAVTRVPVRDPVLMRAFEESANIWQGYPTWSKRLFFLDLDGVFDRLLLGGGIFPHTTVSGPVALLLLRAGGFSVMLNTGRSVEHVRHYCQTYYLPGGVAEHGCVFVDAVEGRELVLIDTATSEQMNHCREAVKGIPGAFIDPRYQYSIRAYRYDNQLTVALGGNEVQKILKRSEYDLLTFITGPQETYIVPKALNKGTGLAAVRKYLKGSDELIGAIGDSALDLPMLEMANFSYAPANCSLKVRKTASNGANLRIMSQPYQLGLLAAAQDILSRCGITACFGRRNVPKEASIVASNARSQLELNLAKNSSVANQDLLISLLQIAERPRWRQLLGALNWRSL